MNKKQQAQELAVAQEDVRVHRTELIISTLLRGGVLTSLVVILLGIIVMFIRHDDYLSDPAQLKHLTNPGAAFPGTLSEIARGLMVPRGQAVIMLGILLLIATPVMRVAVSIVMFIYQRDRIFVLITSLVLALLLLSFALGRAGG